ncbi:Uncharacterised protein [Mycobacteroides abscessus subsp. abscessus]|nr:Uncharacterised protein [Mycobacteroides abscessus subsp. abscessus]SIN50703.1 Uncharacterised protein [Mycobacteroides abscessus subsp. abscessus]
MREKPAGAVSPFTSLEALPLDSNSETASSRSPPDRMTGARGVTMPLPAARDVK